MVNIPSGRVVLWRRLIVATRRPGTCYFWLMRNSLADGGPVEKSRIARSLRCSRLNT